MALSLSPADIVEKAKDGRLAKAPHWERISLSQIASVQNGFAFKSEFFHRTNGMPLIRIRDVSATCTEHQYFGEYDTAYIVEYGEILIGMDGDFKAARWEGPSALLNQRVCRLKLTSECMDEGFLFLCLQPYLNAIHAETSSVTVKHLSSRTVGSLPLPLPPVNEQRRIVTQIESLFAEVDQGVASLKHARAQLALYRQSVLKHAFEGHLTADWRAANPDKLEAPEALLERIRVERGNRHEQAVANWVQNVERWRLAPRESKKPSKPKKPTLLAEIHQQPDLPTGWARVSLGLMIDEPTYGTSKKCEYEIGSTGVLRIPNISAGIIDETDLKSADFDQSELDSYRLEPGDLLIIRSNGSVSLVGKCAVVEKHHTKYVYAGYLIRLRPHTNTALPAYLAIAMTSHDLRKQIEAKAKSTSGVNNINVGEIQSLEICICSPSEQAEIVRRLEAKLSTIDALEAEIDTQLARANALRQSILKKAFSGQLVSQDPNDEPASVLLERIRAVREAAPQPKRRKRRA